MIKFKIILLMCSFLFLYQCKEYDRFEVISPSGLEAKLDVYEINQQEIINSLSKEGYDVKLNTFKIKAYIKTNSQEIYFDEPIRINQNKADTLVVSSGVRSFESGFKYFFGPYSEIYLIRKSDLTVLHEFTLDEIVTNAKVINNTLYFWYGSSNNYRLGRIILS